MRLINGDDLQSGCRELQFFVPVLGTDRQILGWHRFDQLGTPGTKDTGTAFGFRRKHAPGAEIQQEWVYKR